HGSPDRCGLGPELLRTLGDLLQMTNREGQRGSCLRLWVTMIQRSSSSMLSDGKTRNGRANHRTTNLRTFTIAFVGIRPWTLSVPFDLNGSRAHLGCTLLQKRVSNTPLSIEASRYWEMTSVSP